MGAQSPADADVRPGKPPAPVGRQRASGSGGGRQVSMVLLSEARRCHQQNQSKQRERPMKRRQGGIQGALNFVPGRTQQGFLQSLSESFGQFHPCHPVTNDELLKRSPWMGPAVSTKASCHTGHGGVDQEARPHGARVRGAAELSRAGTGAAIPVLTAGPQKQSDWWFKAT